MDVERVVTLAPVPPAKKIYTFGVVSICDILIPLLFRIVYRTQYNHTMYQVSYVRTNDGLITVLPDPSYHGTWTFIMIMEHLYLSSVAGLREFIQVSLSPVLKSITNTCGNQYSLRCHV